MFKLLLTTPLFILFLCYTANGQKYISRLELKPKEIYEVGLDNHLIVDTLIMHKKAVIKFQADEYGVLEAKYAIIGNKCTISAKGEGGKNGDNSMPGNDGQNGGSLSLVLNLKKLGDLTIDTRGGNGGDGKSGKDGFTGTPDREETKATKSPNGEIIYTRVMVPGKDGTNGTNATMGGNAGNGGNIMLMYKTDGFIPIFNHDSRKNNHISILSTAGMEGRNGTPGKGGRGSMDGIVNYTDRNTAQDGKIELVNLEQTAAN